MIPKKDIKKSTPAGTQGFVDTSSRQIITMDNIVLPASAFRKLPPAKETAAAYAYRKFYNAGQTPENQITEQQALQDVRAKGKWFVADNIPGLDLEQAQNDQAVGRFTPEVEKIRNAYIEAYYPSPMTVLAAKPATPKIPDKKIEKINIPEKFNRSFDSKIPPAHYMQGSKARWEPEFANEIDHAVYFAGKVQDFNGKGGRGPKQKEVYDWLKSLGLSYDQIIKHRKKILEKLREAIALPGADKNYPYITIDAVDQDFDIDEDQDEFDETENSVEGLDDLLNFINNEEDIPDKEIAEGIEDQILETVDEDEDDPMGNLSDEEHERLMGADDEDDIEDITKKFTSVINKPKKESSYNSNKKIFDTIQIKFGAIQSALDAINTNLGVQNSLIKASIDTNLAIGELVANQTDLLGEKFDAILNIFQKQNELAQSLSEHKEKMSNENSLEGQQDVAGTTDIDDLTKKPGKKRENNIAKYFKAKLARKLYRKLPKSVRNARQKVRKLQKMPGKALNKVKAKVANKITSLVPKKSAQVASAAAKIRGLSGVGKISKIAGPVKYALAGLEYGERKADGQSEVQALSGVGGGLAGASAGGFAGAKFGGTLGLLLGPKGAAVGAIIGGLVGSIVGGVKGSEAVDSFTGADKVTGAHETGTGLTKPGTALLHGTEAVINKNNIPQENPLQNIGGMLIAATTGYINSAGAIAAPIAPVLKGISGQMAKEYDVPTVLTQTNVGGNLPRIDSELKKIKQKRTGSSSEQLSGIEKDLLETQDPKSFADKLLKMLDPEGKFQELLKQINKNTFNPDNYAGTGVDGDLKGNIVNPMEEGDMQDYPGAKFGAPRNHGTHKGRDIVGPPGMKFVAALPGKVTQIISVADLPRGGESKGVYIKHDNGIETRYLHVNPTVKVGDSVKAGQKLGGITEMDSISSVPHLHFEVLVNGVHRDPEPMLKGSFKLADIGAGKVPGLSIESHSGTAPGATPTGDFDVILPLDHVRPENVRKIPDRKGGNTFKNAAATGADGREREHQDKAANKIKTKLEAKGIRVKIITPEDFGNYEDYDKYIKAESGKGTKIIPIHFDAEVGKGGTGFLTRTAAGDVADKNLASPIQRQLEDFQKLNPELGGISSDTQQNATINRASAGPAALVELGAMVQWERKYGKNFTASGKFDDLSTRVSNAIATSVKPTPRNTAITQPKPENKFQSIQGKDKYPDTKYLIVNQQAKPEVVGQQFVSAGNNKWKSTEELTTTIREIFMTRLGQ